MRLKNFGQRQASKTHLIYQCAGPDRRAFHATGPYAPDFFRKAIPDSVVKRPQAGHVAQHSHLAITTAGT